MPRSHCPARRAWIVFVVFTTRSSPIHIAPLSCALAREGRGTGPRSSVARYEGSDQPMEDILRSDRRTFMRRGAMGAGAFWALSLQDLAARAGSRGPVVVNGVSPYGPISPKLDGTTGL